LSVLFFVRSKHTQRKYSCFARLTIFSRLVSVLVVFVVHARIRSRVNLVPNHVVLVWRRRGSLRILVPKACLVVGDDSERIFYLRRYRLLYFGG